MEFIILFIIRNRSKAIKNQPVINRNVYTDELCTQLITPWLEECLKVIPDFRNSP